MHRRGDRIKEVYAFVVLDDKDDSEGIPAFSAPHPNDPKSEMFMPMVGADYDRMMSLLPMARTMVAQTGKKMRLVKFTHIEELGEVKADDTGV